MSATLLLKNFAYRVVGTSLPLFSALEIGRPSDAVGIIMIHGVYPEAKMGGMQTPQSSVVLRDLEANLRNVKSYSFIGMQEAGEIIKGTKPARKRCLVVTFDDSLKSHVEVIAPKLVEWGIPATFYLSTETIETRRPYWWLRLEYAISKMKNTPVSVMLPSGERITIEPAKKWDYRRKISVALHTSCKPSQAEKVVESVESQVGVNWKELNGACAYTEPMTWDDVRDLSAKGFNIGSHTCTHPNLTLLNLEELRWELEHSKRIIEQQSGKPCQDLSYPHGYHTDKVCQAARTAGYLTAVTTQYPGWNRNGSDAFRLERFSIPKPAYKLPFELTGVKEVLKQSDANALDN